VEASKADNALAVAAEEVDVAELLAVEASKADNALAVAAEEVDMAE